jgi:hypothetical protein
VSKKRKRKERERKGKKADKWIGFQAPPRVTHPLSRIFTHFFKPRRPPLAPYFPFSFSFHGLPLKLQVRIKSSKHWWLNLPLSLSLPLSHLAFEKILIKCHCLGTQSNPKVRGCFSLFDWGKSRCSFSASAHWKNPRSSFPYVFILKEVVGQMKSKQCHVGEHVWLSFTSSLSQDKL